MSRLERFREAQDGADAGFETALQELRAGGKRGHWIWYIFPQIGGLGSSSAAREFAIDDADEAEAYLRDPQLGSRLLTITREVAGQLGGGAKSLRALMGSDIDAKKLVSSLTLFGQVAKTLDRREAGEICRQIAEVADQVLAVAELQGYPPCAYTLQRLRGAT